MICAQRAHIHGICSLMKNHLVPSRLGLIIFFTCQSLVASLLSLVFILPRFYIHSHGPYHSGPLMRMLGLRVRLLLPRPTMTGSSCAPSSSTASATCSDQQAQHSRGMLLASAKRCSCNLSSQVKSVTAATIFCRQLVDRKRWHEMVVWTSGKRLKCASEDPLKGIVFFVEVRTLF
jgi:hypothetical protein